MFIKKNNLRNISSQIVRSIIFDSLRTKAAVPTFSSCIFHVGNCYGRKIHKQNFQFSQFIDKRGGQPLNKITFQIQKATSSSQLRRIFEIQKDNINFIHRTVFLQKVTMRPFDSDQDLTEEVIYSIKENWQYDFPAPDQSNSRAIANIICYMSRRIKMHQLDQQFCSIDFVQLAKFLNPKQFVMTLNGLLKLQLTDKMQQHGGKPFNLQRFIIQNVNEKFYPSFYVSMWFNLLKFHQSSQRLNDFFAGLLKNKHFKNNLIDYMQMVYCTVNSENKRTIDLTYPVSTHPTQLKQNSHIGAHELSVLYEQLSNLKKIKEIYFSDEFNQLLESCYLKILTERDIPLRNLANVFKELVVYENPSDKILQQTFHKYATVIKIQTNMLQSTKPNNKRQKYNVDSLSFATLFQNLIQYYKPKHNYLRQMVALSLNYIEKILANQKIMSQYNQKTFVRILQGIDTASRLYEDIYPGEKLVLNEVLRFRLQKEIMKRNLTDLKGWTKLFNFVYNLNIRSKQVCQKFKKMIQSIPKQSQNTFQERLKRKCILNKNCKNCANCFQN